MADIFDVLPTMTMVLFTLGLIGVFVYERSHSNKTDEPNS